MRNQPIFLPGRKLSPLLGCSHTTISQLAKMATEDGLLIVVGKEHFSSTGKAKAREYHFDLDMLHKMGGNEDESDKTISAVCAAPK
jgi:hypothetical protein